MFLRVVYKHDVILYETAAKAARSFCTFEYLFSAVHIHNLYTSRDVVSVDIEVVFVLGMGGRNQSYFRERSEKNRTLLGTL